MKRPHAPRILMTTDAVGGVWVYATELSRALCGRGADVTLVVMGPRPHPEQVERLRQTCGLRLEITDLALEWMDPSGTDTARARDQLLSIAQRERPDVVHLNSYRDATFDWPAPVLIVAHSCVLTWWQACRGTTPDDQRWHHYAVAVATGLNAADAWIAPTSALRDAIESMYQPSAAGGVIWNGMDLLASVGPKQPFILAAGRLWDEAKNLASLTAIASALDWPVRVAGPVQQPGSSSIRRSTTGVECLGVLPRARLNETMRDAAIFAAPSLYEPFGLSVLEAAASSCALVLSDIPNFRELWDEAALFVNPRDQDALATTLQRLSRDAPLRQRMQQASISRARRYSLHSMVSAYVNLYNTMHLPAGRDGTRSKNTELHA